MADDLNEDPVPPPQRVRLTHEYELSYWTEYFGVSEQMLREALFSVGDRPQDISAYLEKIDID